VDRVPPGAPTVTASSPSSQTWSNADAITLNLTAAVDPGSGLGGYSLVWDDAPATQPDATQELGNVTSVSLNTTANAVMTWYAHLRAIDLVGNVAATALHYGPFQIDRVAPAAQLVGPPTALSGAGIPLSWSGSDAGSGVAGYDEQARLAPSGAWTAWLSNAPPSMLSGIYTPSTPACGQRYEFRARARDVAGNVQTSWSLTQSTLLISAYPISGVVVNNLKQPIYDAQVTSEDGCAALPSDTQGRAFAYFTGGGAYSVSVSHPRFGPLPALRDRSPNDRRLLIVLPPRDNMVTNGHFEATGGWSFFGAAGYTQTAHSGAGGAVIASTGVISQRLTIPAQGVLSLLARVSGNSPGDRASVRVQVDGSLLPLNSAAHPAQFPVASADLVSPTVRRDAGALGAQDAEAPMEDWQHVTLDLRTAGGLPVAMVIEAVDAEPAGLKVVVDEVTLGAPATGMRFLYLPLVRR
jgi:hypothetical protein